VAAANLAHWNARYLLPLLRNGAAARLFVVHSAEDMLVKLLDNLLAQCKLLNVCTAFHFGMGSSLLSMLYPWWSLDTWNPSEFVYEYASYLKHIQLMYHALIDRIVY
jgi:hypothetical protein